MPQKTRNFRLLVMPTAESDPDSKVNSHELSKESKEGTTGNKKNMENGNKDSNPHVGKFHLGIYPNFINLIAIDAGEDESRLSAPKAEITKESSSSKSLEPSKPANSPVEDEEKNTSAPQSRKRSNSTAAETSRPLKEAKLEPVSSSGAAKEKQPSTTSWNEED